jgi:hypothetical protein
VNNVDKILEKEYKIKKRVTYKRFKDLMEFLLTYPSNEEILWKFHEIIDSCSGYKSYTNSLCAKESLEQVIREYKKA